MSKVSPEEMCKKAILHLLDRIHRDEHFGWYAGLGTESFALLTEAYAVLSERPVESVREYFRPINPRNPKDEPVPILGAGFPGPALADERFLKRMDLELVANQNRGDWHDWKPDRMTGHKTCTRNTALLEVKLFSQILSQAALRGEITASPITRLGIAKEQAKEKRELNDDEIQRCIDRLHERDEAGAYLEEEWLRLTFMIGLHTGCRLRETMLVMDKVNFEKRTITFAAPKGGRERSFTRPMPEALLPVLEPLRGRRISHEMPFQPSRGFQHFFQRVGVEGVSFHCLRVTYITRLHRAGVPLAAAMRLVNHSSEAVHRIYQRLNVDDVRQFADVPLFSSTTPQNPSGV